MGGGRCREQGARRAGRMCKPLAVSRPGVPTIEGLDLCHLDLFADGFPHAAFAELRREAPVWWHPPTPNTPGGEGFWCVLDHAHCLATAADAATFSSHTGPGRDGGGTLIDDLPEGFTGVLLNMTDDPLHQRIRALLTPALSPRAVAAMDADLRGRARAIVAGALARGEVDLLVDVAAELPLQAAAALMGVPQEDRHLLLEWADATLDQRPDADGADSGSSAVDRAAELAGALTDYGNALVVRRRTDPGDDLISLAATGRISTEGIQGPRTTGAGTVGAGTCGDGSTGAGNRRPLRDDEVGLLFMLLAAAGTETTRNTIAVGLAKLAAHPGDWSALAADAELRPAAVEEMLRFASSTPYNRRTATADSTLGGVEIAAGDKVVLWWASANRDPAEFPGPDRFDIRRTPNRHLAFGHGSHFCLGARLARLEIRVMLDEVLAAVATVDALGPIEWTRSNKHTGVRHAPVRLHPR